MGVDQRVRLVDNQAPEWAEVCDFLNQRGFPVQMRMINGELAFPDELPPRDWRELRVGTPGGMVTVRREPKDLVLVTWGNADQGMVRAWNALTWAFAEVGRGTVLTQEAEVPASEFGRDADLPDVLRSVTGL